MSDPRGRRTWRPNANEAEVGASFTSQFHAIDAVVSMAGAVARAVLVRVGLARPRPATAIVQEHDAACRWCGAENPSRELACLGCGRRLPTVAASLAAVDELADQDARRRRERWIALAVGVVVALGLWLMAASIERGAVRTLGLQLWWAAGLFWGLFVYCVRRWMDQ